MNKLKWILFGFLLPGALLAQYQINPPQEKGMFQNPIFTGDYPDPSILLDGDEYYMVFTTCHYYPSLPIWRSSDLVNWTPVTYAVTENIGSIWAPDLIKHNGRYYIYFPANKTNWVIWADSIEGPWSDPIDLKIGRIDPGHVVGEDGTRWLHMNHGHYIQLADDGLSVAGEMKHGYDGWEFPREWVAEGKCLEAPKLMKRGEYYYLTTAQGGTAGPATGHMVVSARSKSPIGPWENSPYNPIIRTQHESEQWWSTGHGTPFEDKDGQWWVVFHGYKNGFSQRGRHVLMQPLEWTDDGWFKVPGETTVDGPMKRPLPNSKRIVFPLSDDFVGDELGFQWQFFKDADPERYRVENGSLVLKARGKNPGESYPVTCQAKHESYRVQVDVTLEKGAVGGLTLFYNERAYTACGASPTKLYFSNKAHLRKIEEFSEQQTISLRVENRAGTVNFYRSLDGNTWEKTERSARVASFDHNALGDYLSVRIGLFATGEGEIGFSNFRYEAL
ncbi:family 43 glycosylhydrolase [Pelagicoccus mobilis]|uniref:Family 43 glycosylhydrolase n=1 Tax=Pelagicoccus mobilis TaxID=415221 RepID=A0A934S260_9BACT|nr:family 43 glycosylhydrolase [Pelagicoccus mobilis]MBK1877698.1 family 43 glycosylhydrolase [Pelagicoccus mobilis]